MIVKVCGMKDSQQIREVEKYVDFIGFILYDKSPRYVEKTPATRHAQKVGVFVNSPLDNVKKLSVKHSLDYVQLHGNESPEYCRSVSNYVKVIKAFGIETEDQITDTTFYEEFVDLFLFNTKTEQHGGSGKQFNWEILSFYKGKIPFLLSGGINSNSLQAIKELHHPKLVGVDLNSGFEISPADKNIDELKTFIDAIKSTTVHST